MSKETAPKSGPANRGASPTTEDGEQSGEGRTPSTSSLPSSLPPAPSSSQASSSRLAHTTRSRERNGAASLPPAQSSPSSVTVPTNGSSRAHRGAPRARWRFAAAWRCRVARKSRSAHHRRIPGYVALAPSLRWLRLGIFVLLVAFIANIVYLSPLTDPAAGSAHPRAKPHTPRRGAALWGQYLPAERSGKLEEGPDRVYGQGPGRGLDKAAVPLG